MTFNLSDYRVFIQSPSERFRFLQISSDLSRSLQAPPIPSDPFKPLQLPSDLPDHLKPHQSPSNRFQILSDHFRVLQTSSDPFRSFQTSQTISKPFSSLQITFKPSQTHSESFRALQIPSDPSRPLQITTGPSKSLQIPSDPPERALARSCVRALALSRIGPLATSHPSRARTSRARAQLGNRSVGGAPRWLAKWSDGRYQVYCCTLRASMFS